MNEKFKNGLCLIFSSMIFQFPPFNLFKRAFYRRVFGFRNVQILYNIIIINSHKHLNAEIHIDEGTTLEEDVRIDYSGGIKIGRKVTISPGVKVFTHNHEFTKKQSWGSEGITFSPLEIGDNAWIGSGAIILPRVRKIGHHAIVGAGSVVTKNVNPYEIVGGNPAKHIAKIEDE